MFKTRSSFCFTCAIPIVFFCFWGLSSSFTAIAAPATGRTLIAVGDAHFPPFTYAEEGAPKGFDIDILREIADRQNLNITIKLTDWTSAIHAVRNGKADILIGVSQLEERRKYFDFSERMLSMKSYLFVGRDRIDIASLEDINDSTPVGVERDDVVSHYLQANHPQIVLKEYQSHVTAIEALARDEIAIAALDYYSGSFLLQRKKLTHKIKIIGEPFLETAYCFGVQKGNDRLLIPLNHGLEDLKNDGTVKRLQSRWFGTGYFSSENWRYVGYGLIICMIIAAILFFWNISLHRAIRHRTRLLAENNELFRLFFEHSPVYMFFKDENAKSLNLSRNFEKMLGKPLKELIGKSMGELFPPEMAKAMEEADRKIMREGKPFEVVEKFNDRIYSTIKFPITRKGKPSYLAGFTIDITDHKRTGELLAREKERLAITLRSIGDGVITTDIKGNILTLNKAAEEMTGWLSGEATKLPLLQVFNIVNEHTRAQCENPIEKVITTGTTVELANNTSLVAKDGSEKIIAYSGAPIRDNEGGIIGMVLVFRDMTEKQKLTESIQRAQKLESIGVLAGGIAHDFNNLLSGIFGFVDMANECISAGQPEQAARFLKSTLEVFDRAKALTRQLLTFSKGGAPIRRTLQLAPLINKCAQFALSGSNVVCQPTFADDLWLCDCDENQMGQVIDNIIINAKQAMPMGGKILVKGENVTLQGQAVSPRSGKFVRISITDHGVGMPKEILSRIFDPFFSTKEAGHGLGLATVFSIVQRHAGWIDVESEPGKGSTFTIFIPASASNSADTDSAQENHCGTGNILLMDDEPFMLQIAGNILANMGYTVSEAKDGNEALRLFNEAEQAGKTFAACILDLTIPGGMGGKETVAELRKIRADSIVIAASGYSEDPIMSSPLDHGFSDSIVKPFRKNDVAKLMNRIFSPSRR